MIAVDIGPDSIGSPLVSLGSGRLDEAVDRSGRPAGETDLREADLTGASLVGEDMAGVTLDGGSLKGCQCAGVNFAKASFWNVDVEGADFSAANLAGVMPAVAKNWQLARCDDRTTMPAGWACQDGHPAQSTRGK